MQKVLRKVLCVCIENASRSPMMAALLQKELGNEFFVESAGTCREAAGQPVSYFSLLCMQERGIDLSSHKARWAGILDLSKFQYFVCVGRKEAEQINCFLHKNTGPIFIIRDIPLPQESGLPEYRACLELMDRVVPEIAKRILG